MNKKYLSILILLSFVLTFFNLNSSYAARKPDVVSHDAELLQKAISFNVEWQSEYPVVLVRIAAGNKTKKIELDEYDDNVRDSYGYHGETSLVFEIGEIGIFDEYVTYVIQIEDDLGRRSRSVTGKVKVPKALIGGRRDREDDKIMDEYVDKSPSQKPVGVIDKVLDVMARHDTPPNLKDLKVNKYGREGVSISSEAIDDKGLRNITIRILDQSGNIAGEEILADLGKIWKGTSKTFALKAGVYKAVAQAVDTGGNTSQERSEQFVIEAVGETGEQKFGALIVTIAPEVVFSAGAQWKVDGGEWKNSGITVSNLTAGKHTIEFKDIAAWAKPGNQEIEIKESQTSEATGTYTQDFGALIVTIDPEAAITAGAQWKVDGGEWQNSGVTISGLSSGAHSVEFKDITGWSADKTQSVDIQSAKTNEVQGNYIRVYTTNTDFDEGTLVGLEHKTEADQLQLSKTSTTLPFIWVPNSDMGTMSKVDTRDGKELGRYRTGSSSNANPSRTTVDLQGNCWVGNRGIGTVVKVGLEENGQCIDMDGNGTIETSRDLNGDKVISDDETLEWGKDECVLCETVVIPGKEGTYKPGEYKGSYSGTPGPRGIAIDANNNLWAGLFGGNNYYHIDGSSGKILKTVDFSSSGHSAYGAVIDKNGILWSSSLSNHLLRLDTKNNSFKRIEIGHQTYGIALDKNNHLFVAGWSSNKLSRVNILTDKVEWSVNAPRYPKGLAVDNNGDVWVANYYDNKVTRWSNDGNEKASISVGSMPSGVAIDAEGKPWAVNYGDGYLKRINPDTNTVELEKLVKGQHYSYSDMTGIVARSMTTRIGTWTVVFDSGAGDTRWGTITLNTSTPEGTVAKVRARSSSDQKKWSPWEDLGKGSEIKTTPDGRYLQIETTMQLLSGETSPILKDISVSVK